MVKTYVKIALEKRLNRPGITFHDWDFAFEKEFLRRVESRQSRNKVNPDLTQRKGYSIFIASD